MALRWQDADEKLFRWGIQKAFDYWPPLSPPSSPASSSAPLSSPVSSSAAASPASPASLSLTSSPSSPDASCGFSLSLEPGSSSVFGRLVGAPPSPDCYIGA